MLKKDNSEETAILRKHTHKVHDPHNDVASEPLDSTIMSAFCTMNPEKMYTNNDPHKQIRYIAKAKFTVILALKPILAEIWKTSTNQEAYKNI